MIRRPSELSTKWNEISEEEFRTIFQSFTSLRDLAEFWETRADELYFFAYRVDKSRAYKSFSVPKRNGGVRQVSSPVHRLKYLQRLLHESLAKIGGESGAVHGFVKGKSIVTNASNHAARNYVLNLDLEDFFPSITRERIYGRLRRGPYILEPKIAHLIASLATDSESRLPQGSPSSPTIANAVASRLDSDMIRLCRSYGCWYTRYADDITISTSRNRLAWQIARYPSTRGTIPVVLGDALVDVIEDNGFRVNHTKTRLQYKSSRQMCTGLIVNTDRVSPPRKYIRKTRSTLHHWSVGGWNEAGGVVTSKENRRRFDDRLAFTNHVKGKINYIGMARGFQDAVFKRLREVIGLLSENTKEQM